MENCPSCKAKCQPQDTQCPACGLIFAKWEARQRLSLGLAPAAIPPAPRTKAWALIQRGVTAFVLLFLLWESFTLTLATALNRGISQALFGIVVVFGLAWLLERELKGIRRVWRGEEVPSGPGKLAASLAIVSVVAFIGFIALAFMYFPAQH